MHLPTYYFFHPCTEHVVCLIVWAGWTGRKQRTKVTNYGGSHNISFFSNFHLAWFSLFSYVSFVPSDRWQRSWYFYSFILSLFFECHYGSLSIFSKDFPYWDVVYLLLSCLESWIYMLSNLDFFTVKGFSVPLGYTFWDWFSMRYITK